MPYGDGTGPMWAQERGWRCRRYYGYGRNFGRGFAAPQVSLTNEDQKRILQAELRDIEDEKRAIESRIKELA
jgi:hypothetical protein